MCKVLCAYCNLPVTEKDGTICGSAPWEKEESHSGYHYACENRAEYEEEIIEFTSLIWVESKYRGPGMW